LPKLSVRVKTAAGGGLPFWKISDESIWNVTLILLITKFHVPDVRFVYVTIRLLSNTLYGLPFTFVTKDVAIIYISNYIYKYLYNLSNNIIFWILLIQLLNWLLYYPNLLPYLLLYMEFVSSYKYCHIH